MTDRVEGRPLEDVELARLARDGDVQAYGELVERYREVAFRTAWLITRSSAEAEDAAQEAFVKAFYALDRFRAGEAFRPWVLRIVTNEAKNRRRSVGRRERLTVRLAQALNISEDEITHIRRGALLHDIGKIGIPDSILHKPDTLTEEEWGIMRKHPQFAHDMLSPIEYLRPALAIPYSHHEKWDGTGYPRNITGEEIPMSARLFAIADVWDALTSNRPYRDAWTAEQALAYIREQSGKHFDPQVVDLFFQVIEES